MHERKILIVDDEENARQNISSYLTSTGIRDYGVSISAEARQSCARRRDIVLLDVSSCRMGNGPDLLEEIACMPARPP